MIRNVRVGGVLLGGGEIPVQSMTTTKTSDVESSVAQILSLRNAGCDIVRVAVADEEDARALRAIRARTDVPIVADVHFSAKLAVLAVENGADKLRINPGNIGGDREIAYVADCVKAHGIPVRVGANTGSIEKEHLARYGRSAEALVGSALGTSPCWNGTGSAISSSPSRPPMFRSRWKHTRSCAGSATIRSISA